MDYKHHYNKLVARAKSRVLRDYFETHHIIPKCLGGSNDRENLVALTPEEHFLAHQLLVKIYNNHKLVYAANMMCISSPTTKRNNKLYGWLRRRMARAAKTRVGDKNGSFGRCWYHDPATKEAGKFLSGDQPATWIAGRVPKKIKHCLGCQAPTETITQSWCHSCRKIMRKTLKKQTVFKSEKVKKEYTEQDKVDALKNSNGNIRRALFSLGLNDSGSHYKMMKKLKASLYPPATNRSKG